MRTYLVSGFLYLRDGTHKPSARLVSLEDHELFDAATLPTIAAHCTASLKAEYAHLAATFHSFTVTAFSRLERPNPAYLERRHVDQVIARQWREGVDDPIHLNPASDLPPHDCPLMIEVERGVLLKASRPGPVERRGDDLVYVLANGGTLTGKFRWSYP